MGINNIIDNKILLGAIIGFVFSLLGSWIGRILDRKSVSDSYISQLLAIKPNLIEQIKNMQEGIRQYKKGIESPIMIYHHAKFDTIRGLDRNKIIKYQAWREPYINEVSGLEAATIEISSKLYSIDILSENYKFLKQASDNYHDSRKKVINVFTIEFNKLRRKASDYLVIDSEFENNICFKLFIKEININNNIVTLETLLKVYEKYNTVLREIVLRPQEKFYNELVEFISKTSDAISIFKAEQLDFYNNLEFSLNNSIECYKNLYNDDPKIEAN